MKGRPKKPPREKDLTSRYVSGGMEDEDGIEQTERFKPRNKTLQQDKILRTALLRAEEESGVNLEALPIGEVILVHSLFSQVEHNGVVHLCVIRKTLTKMRDTHVVVGDRVRFQDVTPRDAAGSDTGGGDPEALPEGVIEQILPRRTVLTRADSFKGITQHPIVANAEQMLIVASLRQPRIKWGLIDRMIVAAKSGGLLPIVCLNKIDLAEPAAQTGSADTDTDPDDTAAADREKPEDLATAEAALAHYATLGVPSLRTSVERAIGLEALRETLKGKTTVLAGHSGVGKSSLIRAIQPQLDIRVGEISRYTDKGRHTTTSARRYVLDFGGAVVDTPGVKLFGLWGVTRENLDEFFPDVEAGTAPEWRRESYERILESLPVDDRST
jgi:ribosome biogenesis GTPase / thiamine phosphate phosphatase